MPFDLSPDDIERARRTLALARLRAKRARLCNFAGIYMNQMIRCEMQDNPDGLHLHQVTRAAYQMLDEAVAVSARIDAMEMGL